MRKASSSAPSTTRIAGVSMPLLTPLSAEQARAPLHSAALAPGARSDLREHFGIAAAPCFNHVSVEDTERMCTVRLHLAAEACSLVRDCSAEATAAWCSGAVSEVEASARSVGAAVHGNLSGLLFFAGLATGSAASAAAALLEHRLRSNW